MATLELPDIDWPAPARLRQALPAADAWLSTLAASSAADDPGLGASPRVLFGDVPAALFDPMVAMPGRPAAAGDAEPPPDSAALALLAASGYFGGAWLRAELRKAKPGRPVLGGTDPPSPAAVRDLETRIETPREAVRSEPFTAWETLEETWPGLVFGFGYNQGYLLQILEAPPEEGSVPAEFVVPVGPLWCEYAKVPLRSLPGWRDAARALAAGESPWAAFREPIATQQQAAEGAGRSVWSTGLSVEGFGADAYDLLLDLSATFLAVTQGTALLTVLAVAERDVELARRAGEAAGALAAWQGSYMLGLQDPRLDARNAAPLPRIRV